MWPRNASTASFVEHGQWYRPDRAEEIAGNHLARPIHTAVAGVLDQVLRDDVLATVEIQGVATGLWNVVAPDNASDTPAQPYRAVRLHPVGVLALGRRAPVLSAAKRSVKTARKNKWIRG